MKTPIKNGIFLQYPIGDVTQHFGENVKLYKDSMGWTGGHNGIDLVRPWGEHLFAVESGVICDLKESTEGYGRHIRILAPQKDGTYREWTYGHLSIIGVHLGQEVKEGQFVGCMGNTGFVVSGDTPYWDRNPYAGTHLHFGLRIAEKNDEGWKYPYTGSPRVVIRDYENGTLGSIDPLTAFFTPRGLKVRAVAERFKSRFSYQIAKTI